MRIRDMFVQPIDRNIQGVIKAGERDAAVERHELEEYVVTSELRRYISAFFQSFNRSIGQPWDKMGVWISGFFGSGKSHLLKILSYLLENQDVYGLRPIDYLDGKLKDSGLTAEIRRAAAVPKDVILFNLDTKADSASAARRDTVVGVFTRAFFERLGFCSSPMWLGFMEWILFRMGKYEGFCNAFMTITGEPWVERREWQGLFEEANIVQALVNIGVVKEERRWEFIDDVKESYEMSPESFARMVHDYLKMRGPEHKIVFLVDEMGQFIAGDKKDTLNLQSVTESLGSECRGRAWIVATSQQAIDAVTTKMIGDDFTKILGRFDTRLSLSSANVDEVIKRRLLLKTPTARQTLEVFYPQKKSVIDNLLTFAARTPAKRLFESARDFADIYPFVPYQLDVLQAVFEETREKGAAGTHLAKGARSMLATVQDAALTSADKEEGVLVPFSTFYHSMEEFLESSIREVIEGAKRNPELQPYDGEVLKVLFMLKWVMNVMPATLDNLVVLMSESIDEDKKALRQTLAGSLARLVGQSLVQKDGDVYIFLTDEEQEIDREIKRTSFDLSQAAKLFYDEIFASIFPSKKVRYRKLHNFDFYQKVDGASFGSAKADIGICVRTPLAHKYNPAGEQEIIRESSLNPNQVYMVFPQDHELLEQATTHLRLDVYLKQRDRARIPSNIRAILAAREDQNTKCRDQFARSVRRCIGASQFYVNGSLLKIGSQSSRPPQDVIMEALERVVPSVYTRIDCVTKHYEDPSELRRVAQERTLGGVEQNELAVGDVLQYLIDSGTMNVKVTMKTLVDKYTAKPFGWLLYDLAGVIIRLHQRGDIELIQGAARLERNDGRIVDSLIKNSEMDKVIVRHRRPDDEELVRLIRETAQRVFSKAYLQGDSQAELVSELKSIILDELTASESLVREYDRHHGGYPGREALADWIDTLRLMTSSSADPVKLKKLLAERGSQIYDDSLRMVAPVRNFLTGPQRKIFDDGMKTVGLAREVPVSDLTSEARAAVQQLSAIVQDESPFSQIHRIPDLQRIIEGDYVRMCSEARTETIRLIDDHIGQIEAALDVAMLEKDDLSAITGDLRLLRARLDGMNRLNDIKAAQSTSQAVFSTALKRIEAMVRQANHSASGGHEEGLDPSKAGPVPEQRMRLADLLAEGQWTSPALRNVEEVDAFIRDFSAMLRVAVAAGAIITLE